MDLSGGTFTGNVSMGSNQLTCDFFNSISGFSFNNGNFIVQNLFTLTTTNATIGSGMNLNCDVLKTTYLDMPLNLFTVRDSAGSNNFFTIDGTATGKIFTYLPLSLTGIGTDANGVLQNVTVSGNSVISGIHKGINVVDITTSNSSNTIIRLAYTGTLLKQQRIILNNKTSSDIYIGNKANTSAGYTKCLPNTILRANSMLEFLYDDVNDRFIVLNQNVLSVLNNAYLLKWTGDQELNCKLNTNFVLNCGLNCNNTNTTINSVSGFQNCTGSGVFTNVTVTTSGTVGSATTNAADLTDTESSKLTRLLNVFTSATLTFTGLTQNNYYELVIPCMYWSGTDRAFQFEDLSDCTGYKKTSYNNSFGSGAANSAGVLFSYVFRKTTWANTNFQVRLTNLGGFHWYGAFLVDLGTSL